MWIEYNRTACNGWFQCVQDWDAFEMDVVAGKADLDGAEDGGDGLFRRDVPEADEAAAIAAADSCPVDAIAIYDGDTRIVPPP